MSALKICPQCGTEYPANERFCPRDGTALRSQDPQADLVGSIIADRYHVLRKLGEGGMGQVYLAEHVKMGRKSAVKVMHPRMVKDVDAISRFNREAANASRINHPNIAGIYDFGETSEGIIYLAMEFIEGQSLTSIIQQQGALVPMRAADLLLQTAEALGAAHDMGIVHRDLKPDNIMITKNRDGSDCVKVVDFGIAKAAGSESQKVTKTGLVVGTPEYMSPEQLAGDKLDGRSDIYSLGLVAFNMLTGLLPFPSDSAQESMIMRLTDRPKTLSDMRPEMAWPADLQAVMDKALSRDASQRFQTAPAFGREFYRAIERMPSTKAAQAGTQVLDAAAAAAAVPATRVDVGAAADAERTVAIPAPQVPSKVPATAVSAPTKNRLPLYAGVGFVVVVAAVIATKTLWNGGVPPVTPTGTKTDSTGPAVATQPITTQGAIGSVTPRDTVYPNTSTRTPPAGNPKGTNEQLAKGASNQPLETQLLALLKPSQDPKRSAEVIKRVNDIAPLAKTPVEIRLVETVRAEVSRANGNKDEGCSILQKAIARVDSVNAAAIRERMEVVFACP